MHDNVVTYLNPRQRRLSILLYGHTTKCGILRTGAVGTTNNFLSETSRLVKTHPTVSPCWTFSCVSDDDIDSCETSLPCRRSNLSTAVNIMCWCLVFQFTPGTFSVQSVIVLLWCFAYTSECFHSPDASPWLVSRLHKISSFVPQPIAPRRRYHLCAATRSINIERHTVYAMFFLLCFRHYFRLISYRFRQNKNRRSGSIAGW